MQFLTPEKLATYIKEAQSDNWTNLYPAIVLMTNEYTSNNQYSEDIAHSVLVRLIPWAWASGRKAKWRFKPTRKPT